MYRISSLSDGKSRGDYLKTVMRALTENAAVFFIITVMVYAFYGAVLGVSLMPSAFIICKYIELMGVRSVVSIFLFAVILGLSLYVFWITSLLVFGITERLLTLGLKPGKYHRHSGTVARWLVYSGLHVVLINLSLPYMIGTPFAEMYFRLIGVKMGKHVFINTVKVFDPYLLEFGDNVVVGGFSQITCHIFEGERLILGKVKIGSNTLICAESFIMPGVTIGNHCSIGVCSYVRKNRTIPDNTITMAMPGVSPQRIVELIKDNSKESGV